MKKTLRMLALVFGISCAGALNAYAVPTINGTMALGEWDNIGYTYYLEVFSPQGVNPDGDILTAGDAYDLKRVIILQELEGFGYGGDGNAANDGIYLLIENYADPSLVSTGGVLGTALISMLADFDGDGIVDLKVLHYSTNNGASTAGDVVEVCSGPGPCFPGNPANLNLLAAGGSFQRGSVIEYFFPSGSFGTPFNTQFPFTFIGRITYDNDGSAADDFVIGQLSTVIPEPSSMLLFGSALLGVLGAKRRFKK